jgi:hypothetical protein
LSFDARRSSTLARHACIAHVDFAAAFTAVLTAPLTRPRPAACRRHRRRHVVPPVQLRHERSWSGTAWVYARLGDVTADLASQKPVAAFVLLNGASLAVAALLYVAVERPGLRLRARLRSAAAQPLPEAHEDEVPLAR